MNTKQQDKVTIQQPMMCGFSYRTEPYGGGQRFHCPNCDVRKNGHGLTVISWTNGNISRRFCNNNVFH